MLIGVFKSFLEFLSLTEPKEEFDLKLYFKPDFTIDLKPYLKPELKPSEKRLEYLFKSFEHPVDNTNSLSFFTEDLNKESKLKEELFANKGCFVYYSNTSFNDKPFGRTAKEDEDSRQKYADSMKPYAKPSL